MTYLMKSLADGGCELEVDEVGPTDADGHPEPRAGYRYIGLYSGNTSSVQEGCLEEVYGLMITITVRINEPYDRVGLETILRETTGIDAISDQIRAMMVNQQYAILNEANSLIGASYNGFVEPLFYRGNTNDQLVDASWFAARSNVKTFKGSGIVRRIKFDGARRIQAIGSVG
jgi:hypothetical protein